MSRSLLLAPTILFTLAAPSTGCDQVLELAKQGAEAVGEADNAVADASLSDDDKLGMKLEGYIACINGPSPRVLDAADRYAGWVDIDAGVTGKESSVQGIHDHELDSTCVEGIATSNDAEPDDPELEKTATAWLEAYKAVQPLIHDAHSYYDQKDYKDDDFAKGKEMHAPLAKAIGAFQDADQALRKQVSEKNDALQLRRLEQLEKEEGRKLRFQNANIMAKAKVLMAAGDVPTLEALDLDALDKALTEFEKAHDEADTYVKANEAEADSVTLFGSFIDKGGDLLKAAKALKRRKRDNEPYSDSELRQLGGGSGWMVEGSSAKLNHTYNDLVSSSNRLSWNFYKPNG